MRLSVRNLGAAGWMPDRAKFDLPVDQVSDVGGMRREPDGWQSFGRTIDAVDSITNLRYSAPVWIPENNQLLVITATTIELHGAGGIITDVTPAGGFTDAESWYHTQLGHWFVITNGLDVPHWIDTTGIGGGDKFIPLPGWPADDRCQVVENFKNHLLAARITRDGIYQPNLLKWSGPIALDDTSTNWDVTDLTDNAGEVAIETPGRDIQAIGVLGDMAVIAFDQSIWVLDYTGGVRPPFRLRKTPVSDGAAGRFAMTNVGGALAVFGLRDIYLFNGHGKERSLSDGRITEWIRETVNVGFNPVLEFYPSLNEVHVLCRTAAEGRGDTLLIYHTVLDLWYPVSAVQGGKGGILTRVFMGPRIDGQATTWGDLDSTTWGDLEAAGTRWRDFATVSGDAVLYYEDPENGRLLALDQPGDAWFAETQAIQHARFMLEDAYDVKTLYRLIPMLRGSGTVRFRFGSAYDPQSAVSWGPWIDYAIGSDIAADTVTSGRYFAWEMRALNGARIEEFTGFDLETKLAGRN